jgi:uncharacterized membrane protein
MIDRAGATLLGSPLSDVRPFNRPPVHAPAPSGRVPFVDLARGAAVLFMIQGHTLQVLLAPQYNANLFAAGWLYLRGLTSCTFLILSGFSFSLATVRRWSEFQVPGRRVFKRLGRYLLLLALGYLMRFPARSLAGLATITTAQWQTFAVVDVLQLIAVTLALLQLGVRLLGSPRRFMAWSFSAAAVTALVTPMASQMGWGQTAPVFLGAYLTSVTGSIFPALPWAAYVFFGAGLGVWYAQPAPRAEADDHAGSFLKIGLAMVAGGTLLHAVPWSPYGTVDFWTLSPNLFLVKAGSVLVGLAGAIRLTRGVRALPVVVTALSRESLLIYLVHVVLLYGSAWTIGLTQSVGARLGPGPAVEWIVTLLAAMTLLAWTWYQCKRHLASVAGLVRATAAVAAVYGLFWQV